MPYVPPSRHPTGSTGPSIQLKDKAQRQRAFTNFMEHANKSVSSVHSRHKFYLSGNDSTGSFSDSEEDEKPLNRSCDSLLLPPRANHSSSFTNWYTDSANQSSSSLSSNSQSQKKPATFPLNRLVKVNKSSDGDIDSELYDPNRLENENTVIAFTTTSPRSYSYALMSPNSMSLRLKVLKRSLEILLERPEWLSASVQNDSLPGISLKPSGSFTSISSLSTMNGSPHLQPFGSIPLNHSSSFIKPGSTAGNVMDSVLELERNRGSQSSRDNAGSISSHSTLVSSNNSTHSRTPTIPSQPRPAYLMNSASQKRSPVPKPLPKQQVNKNLPTLGNVTVDKGLLEDLKQIIDFLESGINPELDQDQTSKMIDLHNLSLVNAEQLPKKTSLKIQLLHALATPFEERVSDKNVIAGIPMIHTTASTWGLHSLQQQSQQQLPQMPPPSQGLSMQFHSSSTSKTKSPKAVFTCELEAPWKLLNSNDLACLMFGVSRGNIKTLSLMDLLAPRSRSLVFGRLQRHTEQVFAGEVIAIKRNNDKMAWTSLWAKRKDSFIILIFEQIPCDSVDIVMEKDPSQNDDYVIETAKTASSLFNAQKIRHEKVSKFLPTLDELLKFKDLPKEFKDYPQAKRDSEVANKVRYFTASIHSTDHNKKDEISYLPCAIASEILDPDDETDSEMRLNMHSLPYMAGSFVVSSDGYKVISFNEAIAKNLFGHSDFRMQSIDCILPGFSKLLDEAIADRPGLLYEDGIVLPEHYWRQLRAKELGKTDEERELLFLKSTGISGLHNDGHEIKVDVQLHLIDHRYFLLWITYCRTIFVPMNESVAKPVSEASLKEITAKLRETKLSIDHRNKVLEEHSRNSSLSDKTVSENDPLTNSSNSSSSIAKKLIRSDMQTVPSQLPLFSEVADKLESTGTSSAEMSRSGTSENGSISDTNKLGKATSSKSSSTFDFETASSTTCTSGTPSNSNLSSEEFKLENALTEEALLKKENDYIEEIRSHSKYFPKVVGKERRLKKVKDFHVVKTLGQGAYGKVVVAVRNGDPWYKVVLKAIFKNRILVDTWVKDKNLGTIPSEIQILNTINKDPHPNIMRIVDFFEDDNCYYLETLQRADSTSIDLFDLIEVKPDMNEFECQYIYFQCCSALAHLHKHGIVHRDIKDENIIIDKDFEVQLIDFGSAAYTRDGPFGVFVGTIDYAAPEVLNGKPYDGRAQDVWAMGILLYTLVFKENPFSSVDEILEGKLTFPQYPEVSAECISLIKSILVEKVNERPTMKQILKSKWLENFH